MTGVLCARHSPHLILFRIRHHQQDHPHHANKALPQPFKYPGPSSRVFPRLLFPFFATLFPFLSPLFCLFLRGDKDQWFRL